MNTAALRGRDVPCVATHQLNSTTFFFSSTVGVVTTFKTTTWLVYALVIIRAAEKGHTQ